MLKLGLRIICYARQAQANSEHSENIIIVNKTETKTTYRP